MNSHTPLVPEGASHEIDLSHLSYPERMEHHRRSLRSIAFYQGLDGVEAYRSRFSEAASIFTQINAGASLPKPKGYYPAWRRLVGQWLTDDTTLDRTLGQDVEWLNREIGSGQFDKTRYLSKPLSATERKHAAEVFAERGIALPATVQRRSEVKRAAKALKATAKPGAKPFGTIGTIADGILSIGDRTFAIQSSKGRQFVRPMIEGTQRRIYLDEIEWLASLLGNGSGTPPDPLSMRDRELATSAASSPSDPSEAQCDSNSPAEVAKPDPLELACETASPEESATDPTTASLASRVARLTKGRDERQAAEKVRADELAAMREGGIDPLEA